MRKAFVLMYIAVFIFIAFFAASAFAEEAAPVPADSPSLLGGLLAAVLSAVAVAVAAWVGNGVRKLAGGVLKWLNARASWLIDERRLALVTDLVDTVVADFQQTVVSNVKALAEDGKITKAELESRLRSVRDEVHSMIMDRLKALGIAMLPGEIYSRIEAAVLKLKNTST